MTCEPPVWLYPPEHLVLGRADVHAWRV